MSPKNGERCRGRNDSSSHSNVLGIFTQQIGGLGIHCMLFLAVAVDYALCLWAFRVLRTNNHCWDCFSREKQAINSDRNRNPNGMVKIRTWHAMYLAGAILYARFDAIHNVMHCIKSMQ